MSGSLEHGVRLPDGRVISQNTYLVTIKELLVTDTNARPFPNSSLVRILTRRYRPNDAPDLGVVRRDLGPAPLRNVAPPPINKGEELQEEFEF